MIFKSHQFPVCQDQKASQWRHLFLWLMYGSSLTLPGDSTLFSAAITCSKRVHIKSWFCCIMRTKNRNCDHQVEVRGSVGKLPEPAPLRLDFLTFWAISDFKLRRTSEKEILIRTRLVLWTTKMGQGRMFHWKAASAVRRSRTLRSEKTWVPISPVAD